MLSSSYKWQLQHFYIVAQIMGFIRCDIVVVTKGVAASKCNKISKNKSIVSIIRFQIHHLQTRRFTFGSLLFLQSGYNQVFTIRLNCWQIYHLFENQIACDCKAKFAGFVFFFFLLHTKKKVASIFSSNSFFKCSPQKC